jgi:acetylornithine deacetylase
VTAPTHPTDSAPGPADVRGTPRTGTPVPGGFGAAVHRAIDARRAEILDWTMKLIRFPSENRPPSGNEGDAQEFLAAECRKLGWDPQMFLPTDVPGIQKHPYWLAGREYPTGRRNLAARWPGSGKGRSILFSGHMDVAPFEPDNWRVCRPFEPRVLDGRLYGRGSADMKGGIAAVFWALKILSESGFTPGGDIIFESIVDEEFAGGNGTLAGRLSGFNADLAVLTEPTRMQICPACLGAFLGDITIRGRAGMPYMGSAIANPVFAASRVIALFREWQEEWRRANFHPLFQEKGKELNVVLSSISSTVPGEFTQMGIPLLATVSWIIWCYPGMTEPEFYRKFRAFWQPIFESDPDLAPFTVDLAPTYHHVRPWETQSDHPGVLSAVEAFQSVTGTAPVVGGAPFSCDLGVYGDPGRMPCFILGPRGDNLHAPDEWVLLEDIYTLTEVFADLAVRWSA